jgi:transcription termination factor Rho
MDLMVSIGKGQRGLIVAAANRQDDAAAEHRITERCT